MDLTRRLEFRHWVAIDTLAAAAMIAAVVARQPAGPHGVTTSAPAGVALVCAAALAVAARRRWPLAALAASTTAQVAATFAAPAFAQESLLALALVTYMEERLRIARELHDVVAHSMSVIAVQAGVGHFVIRDRPEEAEKALAAIETTSRESLTEMRRLLDMLREERPGDLLSAPGLADLPVLADQTRRAGLEVELVIADEPRELPVGADLAAFRVIQEALTNVLRHSGSSHCRVSVGYQAGGVTITVTDEGTGPYDGEAGHGLAGMRERVAMYGGGHWQPSGRRLDGHPDAAP